MAINPIYAQTTIAANSSSPKRQEEQVIQDNKPCESDGSKLNLALKCLGSVAVAGLAIYGGSKGLKFFKGKKMPTTLPALVNKTPIKTTAKALESVGKSAEVATKTAEVTTFKGMSANQIIQAYKSGDRTVFRELARVAHPDAKNYNEAFADLFKIVAEAV